MIAFLLACLMISAAEEELTTGPVETVGTGFEFTEGPVWLPGAGLIFSDIPADTIFKADKTAFRKPSGKSNGLTLDPQGRLIACEHGNRRVTRTEPDGAITVLAERYLGRKLNSPNDVVVRSDGQIFFTDPPYGLEGRERELPFSGVYAIAPDGTLTLLSVYFKYPNGLAFSPDERTLYVGDAQAGFVEAFDVAPDGSLGNGRTLCKDAGPDGMKMDEQGRLWIAAKDGIRVYRPDGRQAGLIRFPEQPANCAFGDEDGQTLYVTARHGVYKVRCAVKGVRPGQQTR
jgi:gluconolactonase